VSEYIIDIARLCGSKTLATGVSNVNVPLCVPIRSASVSFTATAPAAFKSEKMTCEADDHMAVPVKSALRAVDTVKSSCPKFSPITDTSCPTVYGIFTGFLSDSTGASNEKV
jgi:hypothetical protein